MITFKIIPAGAGSPWRETEAAWVRSPFGDCRIGLCPEGICRFSCTGGRHRIPESRRDDPAVRRRLQAIADRIFRDRDNLCYEAVAAGTEFQVSVWSELVTVPFGKRITYGDLARRIGIPRAARAVGRAVGSNPLGFLIPCHRVIPSGGGVGHYYWGSKVKAAMLDWEAANER